MIQDRFLCFSLHHTFFLSFFGGMLQWDVMLYVEDDDAYASIVKFVLKQNGFQHRVIHLPSAVEAREYIAGHGQYGDRAQFPLPGLVLADLKMPVMSGLELLQWIRQESNHPLTPFVMLTSSDDLKDVIKAYQLGTNAFLIKPPGIPNLVELMKAIDSFWIKNNVTAG